MSPNWHLWRSRQLEKATRLLSSETPDFVGTFRLIPSDSRLTLKKAKKWLFQKVTSYLWQGQYRSGHRWRSVLRITADKQNIDLCDGQGWTSKKPHGAFKLDFWKTARFRHGFPTDFWRRSSATVWEGYILHLTKSMPIKISEKVKTSRKSHTDLSLRLISLVRFRRDSRLTLKKVKSDCFRRSLPIRTSENINAKDNIGPFWALRVSGLNLEKDTVLSSWTSGRPADSVMDFRLTFEEGQAWLFVKLTSYPWQSRCRSTHQRRSRHLEKATRCSHAWPLQNRSLRLISLARFRLIPSVSEGYIPRIPTRSSTPADDYQENASLSVSEPVPHE